MSLNMYLGETRSQSISMNSICDETIHGMERAIRAIDTFRGSTELQGKSYDSAKNFMSHTYRPLANGIIYLCEELVRQNNGYPEQFASEVAATDVVEQEVREQIQEINRLILQTEDLSGLIPFLNPTIGILRDIKLRLEDKLNRLYTFNTATASNYETAIQLISNVAAGIAEIQGGNGFNRNNGTFSTEGMNLDWVRNLQEIRAHAAYPDYLRENPDEIEKVITILMYEESNPEYVQQIEPLAEQDIVEIKHSMYTAEEPYRTLSLRYLDQFEIDGTNDNAVFRPSENTISFNVADDRVNPRGKYYTFFHEIAHAIDYYSAQENGIEGYYSDSFTTNGNTLTNHMYDDAERNLRSELQRELSAEEYDHLNYAEKTQMETNIIQNLLNRDNYFETLSESERDLQMIIEVEYKDNLDGPNHNVSSDVYGGITGNSIKGSYGHRDDYWVNSDGSVKREPNREGFAGFYGRMMTPDDETRDAGLESINNYLPDSRRHMDEMLESIK